MHKKGNETMSKNDFRKMLAAICFAIVVIPAVFTHKANTRTTTGTYSNGTITTKDGNIWKVSNYNGISTNKSVKVTVKFDTKGTDSVLDDEIIEIKEK